MADFSPASETDRRAGPALQLERVAKSFHDGESELQVLHDVDLALAGGDSIAMLGASGSGKSTLLQIAAGLETPDRGEVRVLGESLRSLGERQLALLRRQHLGFVFQQFNLLPGLKVLDNVLFQRRLNGLPDEDEWTAELYAVLELRPLLHRPVEVLSGGQQQRVAVARALASKPKFVLADEPTGNLDSKSAQVIIDLFKQLSDQGKTILMVTHDPKVAARAERRVAEGQAQRRQHRNEKGEEADEPLDEEQPEPGVMASDRHVFDEADMKGIGQGQSGQIHKFIVVVSLQGNDIQLDGIKPVRIRLFNTGPDLIKSIISRYIFKFFTV